jgi:hypothetical protein
MDALLELVPATRIGIKHPNGTYKSERHFLDFAVNGHSLWEMVGRSRDMVSVLCQEYAPDESSRAANRLLLTERGDFPNDRRSLFICSECGDLGCGAITALVVRERGAIAWKDFGFENTYEKNVVLNEYKGIGPFVFDAVSYEGVLLQAIDRLKALKSL